ncbi:polysaccharide deacetylase [Mobilitalea sibirica]|uniref:Polysaccharide deacetylase n=1 Tax=Mobilitalea sibirica TaxID=1462919 RepID=A0A8J7KUJ7_9FIRM|nr:polysaccharide deacetylase [Mobilitalea sibirica]MBH1942561.1 polysaccharide deacetylase [Mobilitalea sibirica]
MAEHQNEHNSGNPKKKKLKRIILVEALILVSLIGAFLLISALDKNDNSDKQAPIEDNLEDSEREEDIGEDEKPEDKLTPEELEAKLEQERLQKEIEERENLIIQADRLAKSYDYDGAIELIKSYEGDEGGYEVYPVLMEAIEGYEATKASLVLYGGSYTSVTQFNHIFFHSLIADNAKAFDKDRDQTGYNMYMTTVFEFEKMMQSMYEDGYVLVSMHDMVKQVTKEDGSTEFVEAEIYLPEGKKPFVLSQDDVNYYDYMDGDGFASRIVIGEDGKPTTEMIMEDGSVVTGPYDIVPILDAFVEEHPDFSYRGAKGILALTGYEGALGYRTDDPNSPTYEQDKETVKAVAEALKANGWEFASHSWGHKNSQTISYELFQRDTERWANEVAPLIGPTDIYIFPFGVDIETTMGPYVSDKYKLLKEHGFNYFCGVYKEPWMQIKKNYVRMTRRPLDGQAMLEFPERLADLFDVPAIIDPERPDKDW